MKFLRKNINIFYLVNFLEACIFTTSIWAFFFTSYLNFSFSTALSITILSGIISFIFEIPSGAWADKYWRKKLYLLWLFLMIFSFSIWIFANSIYLFIISAILNWIWFAITSGNLEAIIHDNLEIENKEKDFKDIQANAYIWIFSWRSFSSILAWYLFVINPLFPVYGTIIAYFITIILIFFINDKWQQFNNKISSKNHIKDSIIFIYNNSFLFHFIIILALISSFGNIYWYTYQPYFNEIWFNIENIWILFAITWIFSAIWAYIIKKIQNIFSEIQIIYLMLSLLLLSAIFILSFNLVWAILWVICISIMFWFVMSFANNVLMKKSPKTKKSTILSIFSFTITIWYSFFAISSWYIVDYFSLKILYLWNLILIILLIIFSFYKFRKIQWKF